MLQSQYEDSHLCRRDSPKSREENREEEHREDESREEEHRETGVTLHPFDPVKLKKKVTQSQVLKTTAPLKKILLITFYHNFFLKIQLIL